MTIVDGGGCELRVEHRDGRYFTDGAECHLPEDSILSQFGVRHRRFDHFSIDLRTGEFASQFTQLLDTSSGPTYSCAANEGRLRDEPRPGTSVFTGEFNVDADETQATDSCGTRNIQHAAKGIVTLPSVENPTLRIEGMGCALDVERIGEGKWSALRQSCRFDGPVGMNDLGVTNIFIEELVLDQSLHALDASGRITRNSALGLVSSCFTLKTALAL